MNGVFFERRSDPRIGLNQLMTSLSSLHQPLNPLNRSSITSYSRNTVIHFASGNELGKQCMFLVAWLLYCSRHGMSRKNRSDGMVKACQSKWL